MKRIFKIFSIVVVLILGLLFVNVLTGAAIFGWNYGGGNKCIDSDGGINIYKKGTVTQTGGVLGTYYSTDRCTGKAKNLIEVYCSSSKIKFTVKNCPTEYQCSDGACVRSEMSDDQTAPPGLGIGGQINQTNQSNQTNQTNQTGSGSNWTNNSTNTSWSNQTNLTNQTNYSINTDR